jgi:D-alanine--poly(phosphoribitol) ligase subunit 2
MMKEKKMDIREKVLEILQELDDSVDYEHEDKLIDERKVDSFGMIGLIGDMEDTFDIEIDPSDMVNDNFNSLDAIVAMIKRHMDE